MKTWSFDSPDPETTLRLGNLLGSSIGESGLVIGLVGPLGAGKTLFVKGLAEGLGVEPAAVSSPTFVIAQQYPIPSEAAPRPHVLHHVDLYRLESEEELDAIGFSDCFESGSVVAVEWSDRFPGVLGPERLEIELEGPSVAGATPSVAEAETRVRGGRVTAHGGVAEAALEDWAERATRADDRARGAEGMGARPAQRMICLLILALALSVFGRTDSSPVTSLCHEPMSIEEDSLGTLRVHCATGGSSDSGGVRRARVEPTGIGGLLFGRLLPLESVSAPQLEALPGIGPSRAQAIVDARREAPFERLEDLERISGIGPKTVKGLASWVSVAEPSATGSDSQGLVIDSSGEAEDG